LTKIAVPFVNLSINRRKLASKSARKEEHTKQSKTLKTSCIQENASTRTSNARVLIEYSNIINANLLAAQRSQHYSMSKLSGSTEAQRLLSSGRFHSAGAKFGTAIAAKMT